MNITSLDILYIALAVGFISLVVFVNIILYNIIVAIRSVNKSAKTVHDVTQGILKPGRALRLVWLKLVKDLIGSKHK